MSEGVAFINATTLEAIIAEMHRQSGLPYPEGTDNPETFRVDGDVNLVELAAAVDAARLKNNALPREALAEVIQQYWQGPSGRPWASGEKSCCKILPGQAEWFRRLADHILERSKSWPSK